MKKPEVANIGDKFGRWTVIGLLDKMPYERRVVVCECCCGVTKKVLVKSLKRGASKSCGCLKRELASMLSSTHRLTNHRLYRIWNNMKSRCYRLNFTGYKDYGGRGIKICKEWLDNFMVFYNWAIENGYMDHLTIDRIDVNDSYHPLNCRWISRREQNRNKTVTVLIMHNGKSLMVGDWAKELGMSRDTIYSRIMAGWPVEKALTLPKKN